MNEVYASEVIEMIAAKIKEHGDCIFHIERDPEGIVPPNEIAVYDIDGEPVKDNDMPGRAFEFFLQ